MTRRLALGRRGHTWLLHSNAFCVVLALPRFCKPEFPTKNYNTETVGMATNRMQRLYKIASRKKQPTTRVCYSTKVHHSVYPRDNRTIDALLTQNTAMAPFFPYAAGHVLPNRIGSEPDPIQQIRIAESTSRHSRKTSEPGPSLARPSEPHHTRAFHDVPVFRQR